MTAATRVRPAGITNLYFAVCADHGWRFEGPLRDCEQAADEHDEMSHCHTLGCGDSLSNEEVANDAEFCAACLALGAIDEKADSANEEAWLRENAG